MALALAFYRGQGRVTDRVIRAATRSVYSHVELTTSAPERRRLSISSSGRDGGVRLKEIEFNPERWTFIGLRPWYAPDAWARAAEHIGKPYDWTAIALTWAVPLRRQSTRAWFCSELCASALGMRAPELLSPRDLYDRARDMNAAWAAGRMAHA